MNAGLSWPIARMAEATEAVARARRWASPESAGVEAEAVTLRYAAIESELRALGAALMVLDPENILAIVRTDARHAHALAPDGQRVAVPLRELREILCAGVEA